MGDVCYEDGAFYFMHIATIPIDNQTEEDILARVENFLAEDRFHHVVTINPEFIVRAQHDEVFRNVLCGADLRIVDGIGITLAAWWRGERVKARIPGVDLMQKIITIADAKHLRLFLVASNRGLSTWKETRDAIKKTYPRMEISGIDADPDAVASGEYMRHDTDIIFCNFGAPQQEIFLARLRNARIRLGMGVGGSFDYLTGKIMRAPLWMRAVGMEWLWRLMRQPQRLRRIFTAIVLFPLIAISRR